MLLYRMSMKVRRHLFAACLLLCTLIFVLCYIGVHKAHSPTVKALRRNTSWFSQLTATTNQTTSLTPHGTMSANVEAFNNPRKLNEVKSSNKKGVKAPILGDEREEAFLPRKQDGVKHKHMGATLGDAPRENDALDIPNYAEAHGSNTSLSFPQGPESLQPGRLSSDKRISSKTKQLQGSIQKQHALFMKAYQDLLRRNSLLERGTIRDKQKSHQDSDTLGQSRQGAKQTVGGGNNGKSVEGGNHRQSLDSGNNGKSKDGGNHRQSLDGGNNGKSKEGGNQRQSLDGRNNGKSVTGESLKKFGNTDNASSNKAQSQKRLKKTSVHLKRRKSGKGAAYRNRAIEKVRDLNRNTKMTNYTHGILQTEQVLHNSLSHQRRQVEPEGGAPVKELRAAGVEVQVGDNNKLDGARQNMQPARKDQHIVGSLETERNSEPVQNRKDQPISLQRMVDHTDHNIHRSNSVGIHNVQVAPADYVTHVNARNHEGYATNNNNMQRLGSPRANASVQLEVMPEDRGLQAVVVTTPEKTNGKRPLRNDAESYRDLVNRVVQAKVRGSQRKVSLLDKYLFPVHTDFFGEDSSTGVRNKEGDENRVIHDGVQAFEGDRPGSQKVTLYKFQRSEDNPDNGQQAGNGNAGRKRPEKCNGCMRLQFKYLVNGSSICKRSGKGVDLLILISSAPHNDLDRTAIRKTWGQVCRQPGSKVACVFMVANTPDAAQNQRVLNESRQHGDTIVFSFMDAYTNLTYKTLMGLRWTQEFCPLAKFVMKTDEDVYVNTRQLPVLLQAAPSQGFSGGFCWGLSPPHRDPENKWYVSYDQFSSEFFPPMCSGTGYILSRDVVRSVLGVSPDVPFFTLEDVYVAVCLQRLAILPVNLQGFSNMRTEFQACEYKHYVMTSHQVSGMELVDFWEEIQTCPDQEFYPHDLYSPLQLTDIE